MAPGGRAPLAAYVCSFRALCTPEASPCNPAICLTASKPVLKLHHGNLSATLACKTARVSSQSTDKCCLQYAYHWVCLQTSSKSAYLVLLCALIPAMHIPCIYHCILYSMLAVKLLSSSEEWTQSLQCTHPDTKFCNICGGVESCSSLKARTGAACKPVVHIVIVCDTENPG